LNWSVIECSLGIICVSIPSLRPLLNKIAPLALLSNQYTYSFSSKGISTSQKSKGDVQLSSIHKNESRVGINRIDEIDVIFEESEEEVPASRKVAKPPNNFEREARKMETKEVMVS
jgi:hypothetical protein